MGVLVAGGKELQTACSVERHWPALQFKTPRVRKETRYVVLHYTAGTRPAEKMFTKLLGDGLSVHLAVDYDGTVHQYADLDRRCSHAGKLNDSNRDGHEYSGNEHSVGIEVICPGHNLTPAQRDKSEIVAGLARWQILLEEIHGTTLPTAQFTKAQLTAVLELVQAICGHYRLPVAVPMVDGRVISTVMTEPDFLAFRGVVPHFAMRLGKRDCGAAPLRAIAALQLAGLPPRVHAGPDGWEFPGPSRPPEGQAE